MGSKAKLKKLIAVDKCFRCRTEFYLLRVGETFVCIREIYTSNDDAEDSDYVLPTPEDTWDILTLASNDFSYYLSRFTRDREDWQEIPIASLLTHASEKVRRYIHYHLPHLEKPLEEDSSNDLQSDL